MCGRMRGASAGRLPALGSQAAVRFGGFLRTRRFRSHRKRSERFRAYGGLLRPSLRRLRDRSHHRRHEHVRSQPPHASTGQVIHYDELRRLCRLSREEVGEYLREARRELIAAGQPDFCAVVVNDGGWPGEGWGDLTSWPKHLRDAHNFWRDRRSLDNGAFQETHGALPALPGLPR